MKAILHPLLLALLLLPGQAFAADREVDSLRLISTRHYDPSDDSGRGFKAFFRGIGVALFGANTDLEAEVLKAVEADDAVLEYLPSSRERRQLAARIARDMERRYLANGYNNRNVKNAKAYAASEIVDTLVKKVLAKQGLKDQDRAVVWSAKILAPFRACAAEARTDKEVDRCTEVLKADLKSNIALAASYELPRQEFGAQYARKASAGFMDCLRPRRQGAGDRAEPCVLGALKQAALEFSHAKVVAAARKELPQEAAEKLAARVLPGFERCLAKVKERNGFVRCGDNLIAQAGSELAAEAVLSDRRVRAFVKEKAELESLAANARKAFGQCMEENRESGKRDSTGTLRTDNCETFVKMETIRAVATGMLLDRAQDNLKDAPPVVVDNVKRGVSQVLSRCWNSGKDEKANAGCMRKAAIFLAVQVAKERLGHEIPEALVKQDPGLRERLLGGFSQCLEQRLPANLFSATNVDIFTEACAGETFKNAALQVAEAKVRAALAQAAGAAPDENVTQRLIDLYVKKAYAECLGQSPDAKTLEVCSIRLMKNIAYTVAKALLPLKVDAFVSKGGGLAAYGLDAAGRQKLLAEVIEGAKLCLRKTVKGPGLDTAEQQINDCIKKTVKDLTLRLGPLEFERTAKANGVDTKEPAFSALRQDFTSLGLCLDEKSADQFGLGDYLGGIDACQDRLAREFTLKVARTELAKNIRTLLSDLEGPEREQLEAELVKDLEACMSKAGDEAARAACTGRLRENATAALARSGLRKRALKELSLKEAPPELKKVEAALDSCLAAARKSEQDGKTVESCTRDYLKNGTIALGKLVLHQRLKAELKEQFDAVKDKLQPLEQRFAACVSKLDGKVDPAMLKAIDACATKLSDSALEFAMELLLGGGLTQPDPPPPAVVRQPADLSEQELSDMMARAFLCLNGQLLPGSENALQSLDPEGIEKAMLELIALSVRQDLRASQGRFEEVIRKLATDFEAAGSVESRKKLVHGLANDGLADQLLEAMLAQDLQKRLQALPAEARASPGLSKALQENLAKALSSDVKARIRPFLRDHVLVPVLAEGQNPKASAVQLALKAAGRQGLAAILALPELESWKQEAAYQHLLELSR